MSTQALPVVTPDHIKTLAATLRKKMGREQISASESLDFVSQMFGAPDYRTLSGRFTSPETLIEQFEASRVIGTAYSDENHYGSTGQPVQYEYVSTLTGVLRLAHTALAHLRGEAVVDGARLTEGVLFFANDARHTCVEHDETEHYAHHLVASDRCSCETHALAIDAFLEITNGVNLYPTGMADGYNGDVYTHSEGFNLGDLLPLLTFNLEEKLQQAKEGEKVFIGSYRISYLAKEEKFRIVSSGIKQAFDEGQIDLYLRVLLFVDANSGRIQ